MAKVLFLQDVLYEAFGPQVLSAVLKKHGHACDLDVISMEGRRKILPRIRNFNPDVVSFSISSFGFQWAVELAQEIKCEIDTVTLFGGPHPTYFPDFATTEGVDYACRGEGEGAILDLANAIDEDRPHDDVPNLMRRGADGGLISNQLRPLIADLDTLPFPDRDIYFKYRPLRRLGYKRFMVGRGCPYGCSYCFNRAAQEMYKGLGKYVRHRSPANVVAEIQEVRHRYDLQTVGFSDDTFTTNKKWLLEFLDLYRREVAVPFTCLTRINELDEEIARALADAGCHYVSFGLEVGNEEIRKTILNRRMSDNEIRKKSQMLRDVGIPFLTYNMFGVPGETAEDGIKTVQLNAEIGTSLMGASVFSPLLGTAIFDYCKREGFIDDSFDVEDFDRVTSSSPLVNVEDISFLTNLQKIGFIAVGFPSLIPFVARLARWPLGPIFDLAYKVSLFLRYKVRFRLSTLEVIRLGMGSRGRFG
jgi:radical SAM superfamily enzyme YgiQ (UPF0313 family)